MPEVGRGQYPASVIKISGVKSTIYERVVKAAEVSASTIVGAVPRVIGPVHRGVRESHT